MKKIFKNKLRTAIVVVVILVVVGFGYFYFFQGSAPASYAIATVQKGTIVAYVNGTGQVSGRNQVNITPLASGQVTSVDVSQGDYVQAGQTIAVIDESSASAATNQAKAALATAQANYENLISGATALQLQASQLSVDSAKTSISNSYQNMYNDINSVYISAYNSIHNNTDQLFSNPNSIFPLLNYQTSNSSESSLDIGRVNVNNELNRWQSEIQTLNATSSDAQLGVEAQNSIAHLNVLKNFLINLQDSLVNAIITSSFTTATDNSYRTSVSGAISSVEGNISTLTSDIQQIQNSQNSLAQAENSLAQLQSPPTAAAIASAQGSILNAQSQLQQAQTEYNNNIISAPFSGRVAILNIQKGDLITGSTVAGTTGSTEIGSIVSQEKIANISLNEVDVANVNIGDNVILTFNALPNLSLVGSVVEIDAVGTVSQGVVDYNVKIAFSDPNQEILSGMSVSANVITKVHQDVLIVPNNAIKTQNNNSYVSVLNKSDLQALPSDPSLYTSSVAPKNTLIKTGISNDTYTEVDSGLSEGNTIVTQALGSAAASASSQGSARFGGGRMFGL